MSESGADKVLKTPVKDWMTREVHTIHPNATILEVTEVLSTNKIHGLPVVDKDGKLVGVISMSDIMAANARVNKSSRPGFYVLGGHFGGEEKQQTSVLARQIGDLMSPDILACSEDDPLGEAVRLMASRRLHRVLVKDSQGGVAGIVSSSDVMRALAEALGA